MSRTERKVDDLVEEDPSIEDALAVVKRHTEENGGVEYSDVDDDLTTGQWGRLIQEGVVVDTDDGKFELSDPEAVEAAISAEADAAAEVSIDTDFDDEDVEMEGWSTYDKVAGVGVLLMMTGYYFTPIRNAVGGVLGLFLDPLDAAMPFYAVVLVLAMFTGVYSSILQSKLMNAEVIQRQQQKVKALRERKEQAKERGDDEALDRIQQKEMEMMSDQMGMFKEQFRPMVWVTLLTIPIFLWMYYQIQPGAAGTPRILTLGPEYVVATGNGESAGMVLPMLGEIAWNQSVHGLIPFPAWIAWYFLCSMGFSQLIRKAINVQMAATS